jgi:hypothetical protein
MVYSAETLMNTMIRDIKTTVNVEIAGVNGPAKEWRGQLPLTPILHRRTRAPPPPPRAAPRAADWA